LFLLRARGSFLLFLLFCQISQASYGALSLAANRFEELVDSDTAAAQALTAKLAKLADERLTGPEPPSFALGSSALVSSSSSSSSSNLASNSGGGGGGAEEAKDAAAQQQQQQMQQRQQPSPKGSPTLDAVAESVSFAATPGAAAATAAAGKVARKTTATGAARIAADREARAAKALAARTAASEEFTSEGQRGSSRGGGEGARKTSRITFVGSNGTRYPFLD
jgi:hypothetical protein